MRYKTQVKGTVNLIVFILIIPFLPFWLLWKKLKKEHIASTEKRHIVKSCFMFGHGTAPQDILPRIEQAVEEHYTKHGITEFYVGSRGRFDSLAATAVKHVKQQHPEIKLFLVLAYHPSERPVQLSDGFDGSFYPPPENVPKQLAIVKANQYMVDTATTLICYVAHPGNTQTLLEYAAHRKDGLIIENLGL